MGISYEIILLIRGINGHSYPKISMSRLYNLCVRIGLGNVETFIHNGNLIATTPYTVSETAQMLQHAFQLRFGFPIDVVARRADEWANYLTYNPFLEQSKAHPYRVMLLLANRLPAAGAVATLRELAVGKELIESVPDGIWVFYPPKSRSTLTPAVIDDAFGAPTIARDWRTVWALSVMLVERQQRRGGTKFAGSSGL